MRLIAPYANTFSFLNTFISKLFAYLSLLWFSIITLYNLNISFKRSEEIMIYKRSKKIILIFLIVSLFIVFLLPINYYYPDGANYYTYTFGPSISFVFSMFFVLMIVNIIIIIKNGKNKFSKKYIPIILSTILFTIGGIVQNINPSLILNLFIQSLVTFLMYHTIENPDVKLLEELHKSKEISDNANEEKTLFLYNLTQDIKNISSAIDDDADYILQSKNWDETYDCARNIKFNSAKFITMTNDIFDVSQIDSSNIKTYSNKYSIKNILRQIINVYGDICKNKDLKFTTNIDHDIPEELYGDGIGLKEILNTILSNSVKYTDKGYVELNVNTIIKNDVCRLILTIEDSGMGIKSEDINKIKIDNKSLSKANKLITLMNGTMLISSDYGIGTKVKIILDQKIEIKTNVEITKYKEVLDNIKILAVDDSESGLKIIEKLLKGSNIKLDKAMTGKECIDNIKINKYDLILLDEELSRISGNELLQKIKDIKNFDIPVVLLTKDNSYEYNDEYIKNGFVDYILKPLKKELFISKINEYVKKDNLK